MSNFVSVQEASAFFYDRGYATIHVMNDGRVMQRNRSFVHIMPKYEQGAVAYEITPDQLQDMLEAA